MRYQGHKYQNDQCSKVEDAVTIEEALQININNKPYTVMMRSPGNEEEMIHGLFFTEDVYTSEPFLEMEIVKKNDLGYITTVNTNIPEHHLGKGYLSSRSILSVSSCGICGKRELEDIKVEGNAIFSKFRINQSLLTACFKSMNGQQEIFNQTGGSHAAAAFDESGNLLATREDVGRHNAVDKVIGSLLLGKELKKARILLVSGRVSYEIVTKAFRAKIPVLAAVSAPSSLAVDYAKELGITLLGFCRENRFTCYANPDRISSGNVAFHNQEDHFTTTSETNRHE